MNISNIVFTFVLCSLLFSCAKRTTIKVLEPAEISQAAMLKRIAVLNFKNDNVGLSGQIESKLSQRQFNSKAFYNLIDRKNIGAVLEEHKLSDLMQESTTVELGNLLGAEAIISGEVINEGIDNQKYVESRSKCLYFKNSICAKFVYYKVSCTKRIISLSANIRLTSIENSSIIYTENFSKTDESNACRDSSWQKLTSKNVGLSKLSNQIAAEFVYKLTPNYVNIKVDLFDEPQIDYSSQQTELLDSSLEFIKVNNFKKAKALLEKLHKSTGGKSMVSSYNLGVVNEALGNYKEAKIYYDIADELQKKPVAAITEAIARIKVTIRKHAKTQQQLQK